MLNGHTPDVSANGMMLGAAATTVVVWTLSLGGVAMPAEVATALTTLISVGLGVIRGKNGTNRRSGDPNTK